MDGRLGGEQCYRILTACDFPPLHSSILKDHEKIIERALKKLADDNCLHIIKGEKWLTLEKEYFSAEEQFEFDFFQSRELQGFNHFL